MKIILLVGLSLFLVACGDDAPAVGTGDPFSSLSAEPTGLEMYNSIRSALTTSSGVVLIKVRPSIYSQIGLPSGSKTWDCTGGGSIKQVISILSTNQNGSSGAVDSTFDNCSVVLNLGGKSYSETVQGSAKVIITDSGTGTQPSESWSMTISGDLGLSAVCNLTNTGVAVTGQCDFLDSEGTRITLSGTDL